MRNKKIKKKYRIQIKSRMRFQNHSSKKIIKIRKKKSYNLKIILILTILNIIKILLKMRYEKNDGKKYLKSLKIRSR